MVSKEFLDLYEDCRGVLYNNYLHLTDKLRLSEAKIGLENLVLPLCFDNFTDLLESVSAELGYNSEEATIDEQDMFEEKFSEACLHDERYKIMEFITLAGINGYKGVSNIDVARLKEKQFGFESCFSSLAAFSGIDENKAGGGTIVEGKTLTSLLSILRNVSYEEYMEGSCYVDDVKNIMELVTNADKDFSTNNEELLNTIATEFHELITKRCLGIIRKRYTYIMEGAFGVDEYVGVYVPNNLAAFQGVNGYGKSSPIEPNDILSTKYAPIFSNVLNLVDASSVNDKGRIYSGRQFNKNVILQGYLGTQGKTPVYFPYKVLELIAKCELTKKTELLNYRKKPQNKVGNLQAYVSSLCDMFEKNMLDFLYAYLYAYMESQLGDIAESVDSLYSQRNGSIDDDSVRSTPKYRSVRKKYIEDELYKVLIKRDKSWYQDMVQDVQSIMQYYVDCVTTAVVFDRLSLSNERMANGNVIKNIVEFRFKICAKMTRPYSNQNLVAMLAQNLSISANDMKGVEDSNITVDEYGFTCMDFKYVADKDKVYARPVFAYKALQTLVERMSSEGADGANTMPIGWDNILLGKDLSDNLLTSGLKSASGICLQNNRVHYIMSGSRSGKGVMCYNIFATAIGSQIPMFYADRKPDTATVLRELSADMFCFNGGMYKEVFDYNSMFNPSNYTFQYPEYVKNYFIDENVCLDYAYFRCIVLYLCMICYADMGSGEMKEKLQNFFSKGSILVLDEFSNFLTAFLAKKPIVTVEGDQGWFNDCISTEKAVEFFKTMLDKTKKANQNLSKVQRNAKATEEDINAAEEEKIAVEAENRESFPLGRLYMSALADSYQDLLESLQELRNAGGAAYKTMHIFVIGQDFLDIGKYLSAPKMFEAGRGVKKFNTSRNIVPLVHILNSLQTDVITGYQADRPNYLAQGESAYRSKDLLNQSRRCFAYKEFGSLNEKNLEALTNTKDHFKGKPDSIRNYINEWKFFKPFLILNNAIEPSEDLIHPDPSLSKEEVENMRKAEAPASDGRLHYESQYVGQCLTQSEKAGLTWEDLLADNDNGSGHLNDAIGFEGYISMLNGGIPVESMASSGLIATEFVQNVLGYNGTWEEFVCDFRPEWIIAPHWINRGDGSVESRLSGTFFDKSLVARGFFEVMGDRLESLSQYYSGSSEEGLSLDGLESDSEFEEEPVDNNFEFEENDGYSEPSQDYYDNSNTGRHVNNDNVFEGLSDYEDDYYDDEEEEDDLMSDDELYMIADMVIDASGCSFSVMQRQSVVNLIIKTLREWGW